MQVRGTVIYYNRENPFRKEQTIMKTTRKLKTLIATILTLAVALTNATLDNITANASTIYQKDRTEMENVGDLADTTVTMQVGDTKKIDFVEDDGKFQIDLTESNSWSSSDESVVSIRREWGMSIDEKSLELSYLIIKAEKPGTAVITGVNDYAGKTVSFTVNIKAPKVTAKQKKCKHSWKTTKKATCLESGMKTCKKCKLQKVVAKKEHTFATESKEKNDYKYYFVYVCGICGEEFSPLEYGSDEAAKLECGAHEKKYGHDTLDGWQFYEVPVEKETSYKDIQVCETCGYSKMELQIMFDVNDPNKNILIEDLWNQ